MALLVCQLEATANRLALDITLDLPTFLLSIEDEKPNQDCTRKLPRDFTEQASQYLGMRYGALSMACELLLIRVIPNDFNYYLS